MYRVDHTFRLTLPCLVKVESWYLHSSGAGGTRPGWIILYRVEHLVTLLTKMYRVIFISPRLFYPVVNVVLWYPHSSGAGCTRPG